MTDETLKNLFTPFFTTKKRGTGLGMVVSLKIIESHNGKIKVNSKMGTLAQLYKYFFLLISERDKITTWETLQKILIVDDEENIRHLFKKALEKKTSPSTQPPNAEEAIRKINSQEYSLVFSDIFMDGMSGLDLLKHIKEK